MTETVVKSTRGKTKASHAKLPAKRSINLAQVGVEKIDPKAAIPGIVIIIVLAVLLGKFGVADRLSAVSRAEGEMNRVQARLNEAQAQIEAMSGVGDAFAHYTYSGMTQEELSRTDRVDVIDLIKTVIMPGNTTASWTLTENQLTLSVTGASLQDINELARQLEQSPMVNFCTVTTAATIEQNRPVVTPAPADTEEGADTAEYIREETSVKADIIVYLQKTAEDEGK